MGIYALGETDNETRQKAAKRLANAAGSGKLTQRSLSKESRHVSRAKAAQATTI